MAEEEKEGSPIIMNEEEEPQETPDEEQAGGCGFRNLIGIIVLIIATCFALYGIKSCHEAFNEDTSYKPPPPKTKKAKKGKKGKKGKKKVKKKRGKIDYKKPVVRKLPKTLTPAVTLLDKKPTRDDLKALKPFPKLRKFNGDAWNKEKSDIFMAVNDNKLYLLCVFHDSKPDEIVTQNSDKGGGGSAYMDDSVEFFLMPGKNPKVYNQYVCSASGKNQTYYYSIKSDVPTQKSGAQQPSDAQAPVIEGEKFDKGFIVSMEIDLKDIGLKKIAPDDSIAFQVVRNYRGQRNKGSQILHLFPTFIYADKRGGANNHDRRAFEPVKISKAASE